MMVYHGTKADVSEFLQEKSPEGFYLSDSRVMASAFAQNYGGNIMPVFLNMKAPADFEQYESALSDVIGYRDAVPSRLSGMGHDGVLIPTVAGDTTYIAFRSNQIRHGQQWRVFQGQFRSHYGPAPPGPCAIGLANQIPIDGLTQK